MKPIHIVGNQGSFTHAAALARYAGEHTFSSHSSHHDLVTALIEKQVPRDEPSVVPLWNSNTGVINMETKNKTATTKLFLGEAGRIVDLWPREILFKLAIPNGSLSPDSRIFSVKVAQYQCSQFLNQRGILQSNGFVGYNTTPEAATNFDQDQRRNDGLLVGESLLLERGLQPLEEKVTNPNNMTIFATVGCLPSAAHQPPNFFLGCFTSPIEGPELPVEFIDYYGHLVQQALEENPTSSAEVGAPKILFIVRDNDAARVIVLLEATASLSHETTWETPDVENEIDVTEVGDLQCSYSVQATAVIRDRFGCGIYRFYGTDGAYIWMCPDLRITVHGYDKDLVREAARMQVLRLKALVDAGRPASDEAKKILALATNLSQLGLSPDSMPEF